MDSTYMWIYVYIYLCLEICTITQVCIDHKKWEAKICNFFNISVGLGSKWPSNIFLSAFLFLVFFFF